MTVKELINELLECPMNAEVNICTVLNGIDYFIGYPIEKVENVDIKKSEAKTSLASYKKKKIFFNTDISIAN